MISIAGELEWTVSQAVDRLVRIPNEEASRSPAAGKWSPKQIIGHLIDSASNNHQRFVRAMLQDDLIFAGYRQDAWVSLQRYDTASWQDLVELWSRFNLHLARLMAGVPENVSTRPRSAHNLHEVAWESPRPEEPVTLAFFMADYVNHLKHHLRQIDPSLAEMPTQQLPHGKWKAV